MWLDTWWKLCGRSHWATACLGLVIRRLLYKADCFGLRLQFGQQDFYKIQQPSEDLSTGHMYRGPLHALDKKRVGSSGAAPPPVSSLLEGTFWIRERLYLTYDDMQRERNLIILILPAVLPAHWEMHRIFFGLISQVLYSIFLGLIIISLIRVFRIYTHAKRCCFLFLAWM